LIWVNRFDAGVWSEGALGSASANSTDYDGPGAVPIGLGQPGNLKAESGLVRSDPIDQPRVVG